MKARKTVLFIPKWYPNENDVQLGVFVQKHAKALAKYVNVKVVYVTYTEDRPRVEVKRTGNLEEVVEYIYSSNRVLNWWVKRKAYSKWINEYKEIDAVHAHVLGMSSFYAYRMSQKRNIPIYLTEHWTGFYSGAFEQLPKLEQRLYKFLFKKFKRVSVVSTFLEKHLTNHLGSQDIEVIGNVVEPLELPRHASSHKIVVVGDLRDDMKNISGTIWAFHNANLFLKGFALSIIGGGKDDQLLRSLVKKNNIKGVEFLGRLPQHKTQQEIAQAAFVVINSRYETFSVVAIEALSSGVPLIATRCGGPEDFLDTKTGILIPVDDDSALKEAIIKMANEFDTFDKSYLKAISQQYTPDIIGRQMLDFYQFKS